MSLGCFGSILCGCVCTSECVYADVIGGLPASARMCSLVVPVFAKCVGGVVFSSS